MDDAGENIINEANHGEHMDYSEPIKLADYFTVFVNNINKHICQNQLQFGIEQTKPVSLMEAVATSLTDGIPQHIAKKCSVDLLDVDGECPPCTPDLFKKDYIGQKLPENAMKSLATLRVSNTMEARKFVNPLYKTDESWVTPSHVGKSEANDIEPLAEILLKIQVYKPFSSKTRAPNPKIQQEVLVLGCHTLDQLCDLIQCPNKYSKGGDCSDSPQQSTNAPYAKDVYKSGFLYIGSTFYNDFRAPGHVDYSAVIRAWANTKSSCEFKDLNTAVMHETQFKDLTLCLGYPYVYQHQGGCEHLIVFNNARLMTDCTELCSKKYPMHRVITPYIRPHCVLCKYTHADWVLKNSAHIPYDPAYLCSYCFFSFNYKNGKKLYRFEAHPYTVEPQGKSSYAHTPPPRKPTGTTEKPQEQEESKKLPSLYPDGNLFST